jgi:gluconokinase
MTGHLGQSSRPAVKGVVLGVDIGTTSTKTVAFDPTGRVWGSHSVGYPLEEPRPGEAVQDPDTILRAVLTATAAAAAQAAGRGGEIQGLAFSTAMHSLIALDGRGRPLTPSITWADTRASEQAERLHSTPEGLELHRRTGTPMHPMSPFLKLLWFRERDPEVAAAARRWVGIKEYVLAHLTGEQVVDHSVASATGLMDLASLDWDEEALRLAGVDPGQLPRLVPTRQVLPLTAGAAGEFGLDPGTPLVVGATDGPLANLGVGAVRPGVAACSIGTSGALRVMVEKPAVDPGGRVFCYALTEERWVVGGAINNGGVVLEWARDALAPELDPEEAPERLLAEAARAPTGSGGLIMLPYLLSERAPHWSSLPRGAYVGLTRAHHREHLVRAALEGVCQQLALVLESMRAAGNEVREVRATGGFARSPLWRQLLTDALGMDIGFAAGHEGSSFGAALLGMDALGLASIDLAAELVRIEQTTTPDPEAAAVYRELLPLFSALYDALLPSFKTLRQLGPTLPEQPQTRAATEQTTAPAGRKDGP